MAMSLRDKLEKNRSGYDAEGVWQRFLLDSYSGCGGYMGRVKQPPSGYWGQAAEAYTRFAITLSYDGVNKAETDSYLDRFPREDLLKFARRRDVAHYLNYCAPITNLKISYIVRRPLNRQNVPEELKEWMERSEYDEQFRTRAVAAAVLGWFPVIVDKPAAPADAITKAQQGDSDPYVVNTLPCHLRDYELDEQGVLVWAKFGQSVTRTDTWDAAPVTYTRYTIWTRTDFVVYEVPDQDGGADPLPVRGGPHGFGRVPVVSWRADANIEDPLRSTSQIADIALEGRRLFNLISELDEHIRSQVFAILVYPAKQDTAGENSVDVGNKNGLQCDTEQKNLPFYLAPPASVSATLETRAEKSVIEIYRMARVEYDRASGTNSSAQSKQQNFEQTNAALVDFANALARADHDTLYLVGTALGISPDKLDEMEVTAQSSYAAQDLSLELQQVIDAITQLPLLGDQAVIEMLTRLVQQLIPDMSEATKQTVLDEITAKVQQAAKDAEAMKQTALDAAATAADGTADPAEGGGAAPAKQPRLHTASADDETAPNSPLT